MSERNVIGDISIMFRRRSEFFYRAITDMDCQAIRKQDFYDVIEKYREYGMKLKAKAFQRYKDLIRKEVLDHKRKCYEKIFKVNPDERVPNPVNDSTRQDEQAIMRDLDNINPDNDT